MTMIWASPISSEGMTISQTLSVNSKFIKPWAGKYLILPISPSSTVKMVQNFQSDMGLLALRLIETWDIFLRLYAIIFFVWDGVMETMKLFQQKKLSNGLIWIM